MKFLLKIFWIKFQAFFSVENYEVTIAGSKDNGSLSKANIVLNVDERIINSTGEGNGPVNALDNALRKDLGIYNEYIQDLTLVDYKVRILDGGTEAITRVVIESSDTVKIKAGLRLVLAQTLLRHHLKL